MLYHLFKTLRNQKLRILSHGKLLQSKAIAIEISRYLRNLGLKVDRSAVQSRMINLAGRVIKVLHHHCRTGFVANDAPATAAPLTRPKEASATDKAINTAVKLPVKCSASQLLAEAMSSRARLAKSGHNSLRIFDVGHGQCVINGPVRVSATTP